MNHELYKELTTGQGFIANQISVPGEFDEVRSLVVQSFERSFDLSNASLETMRQSHLETSHQDRFATLSVFDRTLDANSAYKLLTHNWIKQVCQELEMFPLDAQASGYPTFIWRLTRPDQHTDFRPLHRDAWFRYVIGEPRIIDEMLPIQVQTVKLWLAIDVVPGMSGLFVCPKSQHNTNIPGYTKQIRDDLIKPLINSQQLNNVNPDYLNSPPGTFCLFGEQLVHGGAPNKSKTCRISLEVAFASKRQTVYEVFKE